MAHSPEGAIDPFDRTARVGAGATHGAMMLVFVTFYPKQEHAYCAAAEPPKSAIGKMSYGEGLKQASDTRSRAAPY
jgi:hypothetical protein